MKSAAAGTEEWSSASLINLTPSFVSAEVSYPERTPATSQWEENISARSMSRTASRTQDVMAGVS